MVLADTSVWIAHFRQTNPLFVTLLEGELILMHPCVSGELACGNLKHRAAILADMQLLPSAKVANDNDARNLLERRRLWGRGLGWIDLQLLASALISNCKLWTLDKRLDSAAHELGLV